MLNIGDCFIMDESMLLSKHYRINNPRITSGIIASISKIDHFYDRWRKSVKELKIENCDPTFTLF